MKNGMFFSGFLFATFCAERFLLELFLRPPPPPWCDLHLRNRLVQGEGDRAEETPKCTLEDAPEHTPEHPETCEQIILLSRLI